jgi:hypothetical protein
MRLRDFSLPAAMTAGRYRGWHDSRCHGKRPVVVSIAVSLNGRNFLRRRHPPLHRRRRYPQPHRRRLRRRRQRAVWFPTRRQTQRPPPLCGTWRGERTGRKGRRPPRRCPRIGLLVGWSTWRRRPLESAGMDAGAASVLLRTVARKSAMCCAMRAMYSARPGIPAMRSAHAAQIRSSCSRGSAEGGEGARRHTGHAAAGWPASRHVAAGRAAGDGGSISADAGSFRRWVDASYFTAKATVERSGIVWWPPTLDWLSTPTTNEHRQELRLHPRGRRPSLHDAGL